MRIIRGGPDTHHGAHIIVDDDGDTSVDVEQSADADIIQFGAGGRAALHTQGRKEVSGSGLPRWSGQVGRNHGANAIPAGIERLHAV